MDLIRKMGWGVVALFLLVAVCSCGTVFEGGRGGAGFRKIENVSYAPEVGGKVREGDLYLPKERVDGERMPAVLLIHGDSRVGTDGRWHLGGIARKLARRGFVVFNITYRMAPDWQFPAPLEDGRLASAWMRDHADEYGVDTERMGVWGYSAGGYVGMLTAMSAWPGDQEFKAVVAGAAPSDLRNYSVGALIQNFLGGTAEEVPERYKEASPVSYVRRDSPPVFFYHGEKDELVSPDHVREMKGRLDEKGVVNEVFWLRGKGHVRAFFFPEGAVEGGICFLEKYLR
ncbi:MAG: prolyl oligopeptidase family serine peptidase [Luteolibacter sp.]